MMHKMLIEAMVKYNKIRRHGYGDGLVVKGDGYGSGHGDRTSYLTTGFRLKWGEGCGHGIGDGYGHKDGNGTNDKG